MSTFLHSHVAADAEISHCFWRCAGASAEPSDSKPRASRACAPIGWLTRLSARTLKADPVPAVYYPLR